LSHVIAVTLTFRLTPIALTLTATVPIVRTINRSLVVGAALARRILRLIGVDRHRRGAIAVFVLGHEHCDSLDGDRDRLSCRRQVTVGG